MGEAGGHVGGRGTGDLSKLFGGENEEEEDCNLRVEQSFSLLNF